jgi:hypothetical protein
MTLSKFEAFLNLLMLLLLVGVFSYFSKAQVAIADVESTPKIEDSRSASIPVEYEMDEFEICTIVDQKPDAVCDKLFNEGVN